MTIQVGTTLVVAPECPSDNFFYRSAVLVVDRMDTGNTMGLMLNKWTSVSTTRMFPHIEGHFSLGGPVDFQVAQGLALLAEGVDDALGFTPIQGRLGRVDLATPAELMTAYSQIRVFAGYTGWNPGQLEQEIANGMWQVDNVDALTMYEMCKQPEVLS